MARQDINEALAETAFLYGGNAAYIEDLYARYQADPNRSTSSGRPSSAALKDDGQAIVQNAKGASWKKPNWPIAANGELVSALDGNWAVVEKVVCDKLAGKAKAAGVALSAVRRAAGDARFRARHHDDPRLPHARPSPRQARSARHRAGQAIRRSCRRRPTASPRPISTARSSSTTCSGWSSRPSARCRRSCGAPTAAPSASSSCTSPIRSRRPGCRSGSRGRTRRSPSPARARAPS